MPQLSACRCHHSTISVTVAIDSIECNIFSDIKDAKTMQNQHSMPCYKFDLGSNCPWVKLRLFLAGHRCAGKGCGNGGCAFFLTLAPKQS